MKTISRWLFIPHNKEKYYTKYSYYLFLTALSVETCGTKQPLVDIKLRLAVIVRIMRMRQYVDLVKNLAIFIKKLYL